MTTTFKSAVVIFLVMCIILAFIPISQEDNVIAQSHEVSDSAGFINALQTAATGDTIVINGEITISYTASKPVLNQTGIVTKGLNIVGKEGTGAKIKGRLLLNTSEEVSISGVDFEFTSLNYGDPNPESTSTSDRGVIVVGKTNANLSISNSVITQRGFSDIITVGYLTGTGSNNMLNLNNVTLNGPNGNCQGITIRTASSGANLVSSTIQDLDPSATSFIKFGITSQTNNPIISVSNSTITGQYALKVGGPNGDIDVSESNINGWSAISTVTNATNTTIDVDKSTLTGTMRFAGDSNDYGIITYEKGANNGALTIDSSTIRVNEAAPSEAKQSCVFGILNTGTNNQFDISNSKLITGTNKATSLDTGILSHYPISPLNINKNYWGGQS